MGGKNNFYVVTVGKDVGVFKKWLQVSHVREGTNCEGYETQEEAVQAFDEALTNGFVKISGSFDHPYQSPRIHPPLDCPPYSCGPASVAVPNSPPPTPGGVRARSTSITAPAPVHVPIFAPSTPSHSTFLPPSVFENASFGDIPGYAQNVTIRSPKREKPSINTPNSPKQNKKIQTVDRAEGACAQCGCDYTTDPRQKQQQKGVSSSRSTSDPSQSAKGKQSTRRDELSVISSESESDDVFTRSSISDEKNAPITPRRTHSHILTSVHSTHRSSIRAKPVLRTLSAPPNSSTFASPLSSPSRIHQKSKTQSPTTAAITPRPTAMTSRYHRNLTTQYPTSATTTTSSSQPPNAVIDISDVESYPSSDSSVSGSKSDEEDSSGPEDVTPLQTRQRLLSPLTSPDLKNAVLTDGVGVGVHGHPDIKGKKTTFSNSSPSAQRKRISPYTPNCTADVFTTGTSLSAAAGHLVSPRQGHSSSSSPRVSSSSGFGGSEVEQSSSNDGVSCALGLLHQFPAPTNISAIYNDILDPRSPIRRNRVMALGESDSSSSPSSTPFELRPSPRAKTRIPGLRSPGKLVLLEN
ncbi:hypothetical protein C8R41DRAFT_823274 [Lentinula lateritia]|uniref:Uncharacterized protein n=1 Tax=Lentinula lateritia TaxID=40482 RepID=A0ABQ8VL56_9AGAR|nr:hypothetical protein C8R41DRAFT_823274 [Lentinula lateritia]